MKNPEFNTRRVVEEILITKVFRDPGFKKRLLENPSAVVQEELTRFEPNAKIPSGVEVRVVEEAPDVVYLVLPSAATAPGKKAMSEAELANVAGGFGSSALPSGMTPQMSSWGGCGGSPPAPPSPPSPGCCCMRQTRQNTVDSTATDQPAGTLGW